MNNAATPAPTYSRLAARLSILAAALMWSSSGLFAQAPMFDVWPTADRGVILAFWRAAFACLVLVPMIRRPRWNVRLVPMTLCFALMSFSFLTAMSQTSVANTVWLQATSPWWVFLIAVLILREPVVRRDLVPLAFGAAGVGLILAFEFRLAPQDVVGVAWGLVSGVTYAVVVTLMRQLRGHNAAWLIGLNHLVVTIALLPLMLGTGIWPSPSQLGVLALFGVFQMAIPYVLVSRALRSVSSQEVIALYLVEPVLAPVWVYLAWGKVPAWWTIAGGGLILAGLILRYVVLELRGPGDDQRRD